MHTAIYALIRLVLFGFGWIVAAVLAMAADMMATGTKWPIFCVFAAWWTYACAIYVQGEAVSSETRNLESLRARQPDS